MVVLTGSAGGSLSTCEDVTTASTTGTLKSPDPVILCREHEETRDDEPENRATHLPLTEPHAAILTYYANPLLFRAGSLRRPATLRLRRRLRSTPPCPPPWVPLKPGLRPLPLASAPSRASRLHVSIGGVGSLGWQAWPWTVFNGRQSRGGTGRAVTVARIAGFGPVMDVVAVHATSSLEGGQNSCGVQRSERTMRSFARKIRMGAHSNSRHVLTCPNFLMTPASPQSPSPP